MAHRNVHILLAVLGISGITALFLSFTEDVSPMYATSEPRYWTLALPLVLSVPILAASVRWTVSGGFSRPECVVAYAMSLGTAGVTLSFYWPTSEWTSELEG